MNKDRRHESDEDVRSDFIQNVALARSFLPANKLTAEIMMEENKVVRESIAEITSQSFILDTKKGQMQIPFTEVLKFNFLFPFEAPTMKTDGVPKSSF